MIIMKIIILMLASTYIIIIIIIIIKLMLTFLVRSSNPFLVDGHHYTSYLIDLWKLNSYFIITIYSFFSYSYLRYYVVYD